MSWKGWKGCLRKRERKRRRERRQVNEGEGRKRFMAARINFFFERSRGLEFIGRSLLAATLNLTG